MPATATIGTLRLRSRGRSGVVERLRVESRLARAELEPPSLPPSAILIVRSISSRVAIDGTADLGEVRQRLESLHRRATSPGRRPDLRAPAIVFTGEAELAAWFAIDVVDHVVADHWWWRHAGLRRGLSPVAQLVVYLEEHPRCVPEAVKLLAYSGSLGAVARLFSPAQSTTVLRAVSQTFELEIWESSPGVGEAYPAPAGRPSSAVAPAWRDWFPAAQIDGLPPETRLLIVVALGLVRAPREVRSAGFVREAAQWLATGPRPARATPTVEDRPERTPSHTSTDAPTAFGGSPVEGLQPVRRPTGTEEVTVVANLDRSHASQRAVALSQRSVPTETAVAAHRADASATLTADPTETVPSTIAPGQASAGLRTVVNSTVLDGPHATVTPATSPGESDTRMASDATALPAFEAAGVRTSLAGALFLINLLLLRLERRDSSGTGFAIAAAVGPWAMLEAVTLKLLDSLPEAAANEDTWKSDPLWAQLAVLDGRQPTQRRGHGLPRIPGLARLVPVLRDQLASGLDTDPDGAVRLVVVRSGRLFVTGTHVDVVMALDDVSGQVRRAGLDIDPGWQPRYQRVIKFHYR